MQYQRWLAISEAQTLRTEQVGLSSTTAPLHKPTLPFLKVAPKEAENCSMAVAVIQFWKV